MAAGKKKSNGSGISLIAIIVWVVLALVCIQGYLFLKNRSGDEMRKPQVEKPVVKLKPVRQKPLPPVKAEPSVRKKGDPVGRIAIVLDDWGYNNSHCKYLSAIPGPVGVAILPGLPYSRDIIQCAHEYNKQPMLHLPLEPHSLKEIYKDGYVLKSDMNSAVLKKTLTKILSEMSGVIGVNNHTGSKGSESELLMTVLLSEVKKRNLFYLDSVTSEKTVSARVAAKLKMRIAKRDVFLDNRNDRDMIERQFAELAKRARTNGYALAIGHDRALTLQILIEQMKKLTSEGYEFISVPEYIKRNEYPRH